MSSKLGYTWYPKDWGNSESVFELTLSERGMYRELIDLAMLNDNKTEIKKSVWIRKFGVDLNDLNAILNTLISLHLIIIDEDLLFIPSCENRLNLVRGGKKGGAKNKPTPKPTPKPILNNGENIPKPTPKQIETKTKLNLKENKEKEEEKEFLSDDDDELDRNIKLSFLEVEKNKEKNIAPKKENNLSISESLKYESPEWLDNVAMQQRHLPIIIIQKIDEFLIFLKTQEKEHTSRKEFVSHFINWISKKAQINQNKDPAKKENFIAGRQTEETLTSNFQKFKNYAK